MTFELKKGLWYRLYKHPKASKGEQRHQMIVPKTLRKQIMKVAHESVMSEHQGIQRRETGSSTLHGASSSNGSENVRADFHSRVC